MSEWDEATQPAPEPDGRIVFTGLDRRPTLYATVDSVGFRALAAFCTEHLTTGFLRFPQPPDVVTLLAHPIRLVWARNDLRPAFTPATVAEFVQSEICAPLCEVTLTGDETLHLGAAPFEGELIRDRRVVSVMNPYAFHAVVACGLATLQLGQIMREAQIDCQQLAPGVIHDRMMIRVRATPKQVTEVRTWLKARYRMVFANWPVQVTLVG